MHKEGIQGKLSSDGNSLGSKCSKAKATSMNTGEEGGTNESKRGPVSLEAQAQADTADGEERKNKRAKTSKQRASCSWFRTSKKGERKAGSRAEKRRSEVRGNQAWNMKALQRHRRQNYRNQGTAGRSSGSASKKTRKTNSTGDGWVEGRRLPALYTSVSTNRDKATGEEKLGTGRKRGKAPYRQLKVPPGIEVKEQLG